MVNLFVCIPLTTNNYDRFGDRFVWSVSITGTFVTAANVIFAVLLWWGRRLGFWGLIATVPLGILWSIVPMITTTYGNATDRVIFAVFAVVNLAWLLTFTLLLRPHWARLK